MLDHVCGTQVSVWGKQFLDRMGDIIKNLSAKMQELVLMWKMQLKWQEMIAERVLEDIPKLDMKRKGDILTNDLNMKKVCTKIVMENNSYKKIMKTFPQTFQRGCWKTLILGGIVIGDEP
jgi:hypothetical protein